MILDKIIDSKKEEVAHHKRKLFLEDMKGQVRDAFPTISLLKALKGEGTKIIAEIKRASPSAGPLRPDLNPMDLAQSYNEAGASAISILTDKPFFQGSLDDLKKVRERVRLPLLRKDFLIDPYQVYEARCFGADAILLIARILAPNQLEDLMGLATTLGLDSLVEVHSQREWESVKDKKPKLLGINNRDLDALKTDIETTIRLVEDIPDDIVLISESGIETLEDIKRLKEEAGVFRFLIGEALLKTPNPAKKLEKLLNG